jgi:sugar transferase (PEP-CTERM system associated)
VFRILYSWAIQITKEKVLIVGTNETAQLIAHELSNGNCLEYEVQGFIANNTTDIVSNLVDDPILGHVHNLQEIVHEAKPGVLVIALSERRGTFPYREILDCKLRGIKVEDWPTFYEKLTGKIIIHNLRPSWLIFSEGFAAKRLTILLKRAIDIILSLMGLFLTLPLMVIIAIAIKCDSVGPVFFRQERVGENGKIFTLTKFRTMVADAEKHTGPIWAQTTDTRVTKLGHILRRTGLDELPQMFNVLQGHMSFVGPRPERPYFVSELQEKIPYYALRLTVKPGITGWAQVRYGYGATIEDAIEKLQFDLYYIKNMSLFLDFLVVLSTIHKVLSAKVAIQNVPSGRLQSLPFRSQNGVGRTEASKSQ